MSRAGPQDATTARLDHVETRVSGLEQKVDDGFTQVNRSIGEMGNRIVGLIEAKDSAARGEIASVRSDIEQAKVAAAGSGTWSWQTFTAIFGSLALAISVGGTITKMYIDGQITGVEKSRQADRELAEYKIAAAKEVAAITAKAQDEVRSILRGSIESRLDRAEAENTQARDHMKALEGATTMLAKDSAWRHESGMARMDSIEQFVRLLWIKANGHDVPQPQPPQRGPDRALDDVGVLP